MPHQPDHAAHDELLISAHVAGDTDGADAERANVLLAACSDCAQLASDLRAIAAALPNAALAPRPRDFRLPDVTTARVPNGLSLERLRRSLRPAGAGLAALGIAGLLLAGATNLGGASSGAILSNVGAAIGASGVGQDAYSAGGAASAPSPAATAAPSVARPEVALTPPPSAVDNGVRGGLGSTPSGSSADGGPKAGPIPPTPPPSGPSPLVVGSVAVFALGLVLLVASRVLRREESPSR